MVCVTTIHGADPFLTEIKYTPTVTALPFKDDKKTLCNERHNDDSDDEEFEGHGGEDDQLEDVSALRITTRARLSYNLQSYDKNAMLVFNANADFVHASDLIPERVSAILETFTKFRFEIETHMDLRNAAIVEKCDEFFQRDFTEYGCVAIIMLSLDGTEAVTSTILENWRADRNPTLQHKPKLYINDASQRLAYREIVQSTSRLRPPISVDHPDVLYLRLPPIFRLSDPQPFQILCEKLNNMADYDDVMTIIETAIRVTKPLYRRKIHVASTLEKLVFLARSGTEITSL